MIAGPFVLEEDSRESNLRITVQNLNPSERAALHGALLPANGKDLRNTQTRVGRY